MKRIKNNILLVFASVSLLFFAFTQPEILSKNEEKIALAFKSYVDSIHPQKIYLQLDKEEYYSRERINFCSYLLDGLTYKPDTADAHIYVELINPFKQLSQIVRVKQVNGIGSGSLYLADTIPEGLYQIRAYTNRMKNYSPHFYFYKTFSIHNSINRLIVNPKEAKKNKTKLSKIEKQKMKYEITFFPEGGQMLVGRPSRIAFKVVNEYGETGFAAGEVFNNKHEKITDFRVEHKGMGSFNLIPLKEETYFAQVNFGEDQIEKISLPLAQQNYESLSISESKDKIAVHLISNKQKSGDRPANEFILIGQSRGKIYYSKSLNLIDNDTIDYINKDIFPAGIIQFTLINHRLLPVSERLFFIPPRTQNYLFFDTNADQDSLYLNIKKNMNTNDNSYFTASVSAILVKNNYTSPPENIVSNILLTSDLPGKIEDASYYLQSGIPEVAKNIDLLMLTHGWTRYYWSDIISGKYPKQIYESEKGISLKGKITYDLIEIPYSDAHVKLSIMNRYNDQFSTFSGKKGEFIFDNLNYNDTIDVKVIARKPNGGKNLLIQVETYQADDIVDYNGDFFLTTQSDITMKDYRRRMNSIAREQARQREKELDSIFSSTIYGRPDYVIWSDQIPPGSKNLLEVLQGRVPGLLVSGDKVIIRGINTIMLSTDPLILVDGVPADIDVLQTMPPVQVDRIDIIKGHGTTMFGSRGGNGVIAIYSKHGRYLIKGEISFSMLGYHVAQKFNQPKEKTVNERIAKNKLPLTLYWEAGMKVDTNEVKKSISIPANGSNILLVVEGIDQEGHPAATYSLISY